MICQKIKIQTGLAFAVWKYLCGDLGDLVFNFFLIKKNHYRNSRELRHQDHQDHHQKNSRAGKK